jgi:hypothetical protein
LQLVTTDDTARRMDDVSMADVCFRIEGPLYEQGAAMLAIDDAGSRGAPSKRELQLCTPSFWW